MNRIICRVIISVDLNRKETRNEWELLNVKFGSKSKIERSRRFKYRGTDEWIIVNLILGNCITGMRNAFNYRGTVATYEHLLYR
jgi:hypothetical protein